MLTTVPQEQEFVPVLLGADAATYSVARSFHEAYGVVSLAVSRLGAGPVRSSRIIEVSRCPGFPDPDALVAHLDEVAARFGDRPLLLLSSTDHLVKRIVSLRDRLEPRWTIPYTDGALMERMTDKARFSELCAELGISHPRTVVYDVSRHEELKDSLELDLTYPVIAKNGNSALYEEYDFPGKAKVHTAGSREELMDLMQRVHDSGYPGTFILQDMIPGGDDGMRILTTYSDRNGKVRAAAYGHVLLEEHLPATLGIPAAIITEQHHEVVAQATRLLEHVGWTGYANFDLKHDPRDGSVAFFELNPRLGRSSFYVNAAGMSTAEYYVREHVRGESLDDDPPLREASEERLYTSLPVPLVLGYLPGPLRRRVLRLVSRGRVVNPMHYHRDPDPRRLAYVAAFGANQVRKYARVYPPSQARRAREDR